MEVRLEVDLSDESGSDQSAGRVGLQFAAGGAGRRIHERADSTDHDRNPLVLTGDLKLTFHSAGQVTQV